MRGRKPQTGEVKEAKGNPGRRPIVKSPAALGSGAMIKAPVDLGAAAKRIWNEIAPNLARVNFLRDTDRRAFARYCTHLARWRELTNELKKGETYETTSLHGTMKRIDPKFMVRERIENRLEALEDRFGLNPASRQQLLQRQATLPNLGDLFNQPAAGAPPSGPAEDDKPDAPAAPASPVGFLRGSNAIN